MSVCACATEIGASSCAGTNKHIYAHMHCYGIAPDGYKNRSRALVNEADICGLKRMATTVTLTQKLGDKEKQQVAVDQGARLGTVKNNLPNGNKGIQYAMLYHDQLCYAVAAV